MSKTNAQLQKEIQELKNKVVGCEQAYALANNRTQSSVAIIETLKAQKNEAEAENDKLRAMLNTRDVKAGIPELKPKMQDVNYVFEKGSQKSVAINLMTVALESGIKNPVDMSIMETKRMSIALKNVFELSI